MRTTIVFASLSLAVSIDAAEPAVSQPAAPPSGYQFHEARPGYNPVEAELAALRDRKDVTFSAQSGWTIVTLEDGLTIWSFTPADHPAHPAFAKRWVFQKDGAWHQDMNVMCGASKQTCDKLVEDFKVLNEHLRDSLQRSKGR